MSKKKSVQQKEFRLLLNKFGIKKEQLTSIKKRLVWKKQIPNKAGYWLRVNAGHRVQLHRIYKADKIMPNAGKLCICWGFDGGTEVLLNEPKMQEKMKYFYWYGPLPIPPKEAL